MEQPVILVFDSGLGGMTVYRQLHKLFPQARYIYGADNAAFPYGAWEQGALCQRISTVIEQISELYPPDLVVIACNTASTIALSALREKFPMPFVGTVPAIKVAAERSVSKVFSVLATQGTVKRDYTHDLVRKFAKGCNVTLVGAGSLAQMAEQKMRGIPVDMEELRAISKSCFVEKDGQKTDHIVLACTHFPLLSEELARVAQWPVTFIDPAAAIARQGISLLKKSVMVEADCLEQSASPPGDLVADQSASTTDTQRLENIVLFTGECEIEPALQSFLFSEGFAKIGFL